MKLGHCKGLVDRESYISQYLGLAILTSGVASSIGADDLLACFAAGQRGFTVLQHVIVKSHPLKGCAISWDPHFKNQTADDSFPSVIDYIVNCGCFIYIGAWLPFESYNSPELGLTPWRLVALMLSILVLRRIPPLLLLYKWVPEITSWKEAMFSGHFGMPTPSGVP